MPSVLARFFASLCRAAKACSEPKMIARLQRILSGVELFALVLWVGGGFVLSVFAYPILGRVLGGEGDDSWAAIRAVSISFQRAALIFAAVVLVSNFLKGAIYLRHIPFQRFALLAATIMFMFTVVEVFVLHPRLDDKASQIASLKDQPATRLQEEVRELRRQLKVVEAGNVALGLFLVYAFRHFEERKPQALLQILAAGTP